MKRRVVVTGLGVVSPFGPGLDLFWTELTRGTSAVRRIGRFDATPFPSQIAAEVIGFSAEAYLPRRDIVRTDTFIHFALTAAIEAFRDAKLEPSPGDPRIGVSIGTSMGGLPLIFTTYDGLQREQMRGVNPYAMPGFLPNMAASWVSMRFGARGPIASATTACAAGGQALGDACRFIERGDADVMISGGTDALVNPFVVACFSALRALSTRNDDPAAASRPFDKNRDGFVLGEGAGIMVLEEREHALDRGAHIYAELAGYAMTADAHHPTASTVDGPARAIAGALADAGIPPDEVEYINAHGTSTPHNDANETRAIREVFGAHAYKLAVSSTKSMIGHLLGAAGAVEAVATVLALEHGMLPQTINYSTPDPECDLDYVPNKVRPRPIRVAVSNSFGFGGVNASLVFKKPDA
jgi:3-oxoacyl-[acyl-carrier-protein] synthase II